MRIKRITSQDRRDFQAIFECEHCHYTVDRWGYDDENFHRNVIPSWVCGKCAKTASEDYRPLAPKYPPGVIV